jgi:hypothetical protein
MKRTIGLLLLLTVGMTVGATEQSLSFRVEFPFEVRGVAMPAGDYKLQALEEDANALRLVHEGSGKSVFVSLPSTDKTRQGPRAYPQIVFQCEHRTCEIASVRNMRPGLVLSSWKAGTAERNLYLRTVALR